MDRFWFTRRRAQCLTHEVHIARQAVKERERQQKKDGAKERKVARTKNKEKREAEQQEKKKNREEEKQKREEEKQKNKEEKKKKAEAKEEEKLREKLRKEEDKLRKEAERKKKKEPTYCVCNQVASGEMVKCESSKKKCGNNWFHVECVLTKSALAALKNNPEQKYICEECK